MFPAYRDFLGYIYSEIKAETGACSSQHAEMLKKEQARYSFCLSFEGGGKQMLILEVAGLGGQQKLSTSLNYTIWGPEAPW